MIQFLRLFVLRIIAIPPIAVKRLWVQKWLTLITILGLTIAISLFMTVPLYSDGVNFRILEQRLATQTESRNRPPFAYLFSYIGSWHGSVEWEEFSEADTYLMEEGSLRLNMPRTEAVRHFESDLFEIFTRDVDASEYDDRTKRLTLLKYAFITDVFNKITLVEGTLPQAQPQGDPIEVLVTQAFADEVGFQPGESYIAFRNGEDSQTNSMTILVTGIWRQTNPLDPYWIYSSTAYDDLMLLEEDAFIAQVAPVIEKEVNLAAWYFVMDGQGIGPDDVDRTIGSLILVERRLQTLLPNASTFINPTDALIRYRQDVNRLNRILFAFNLPTIGLVLAFIGLVGNLWADRRRNELAVLRSRGSSFAQLMGSILIETLIIAAISFALSLLLSQQLATWVGRVRSFLDFSSPETIRVIIGQSALLFGVIAAGLGILAQIVPTIAAAQQTVVSYKLVQARTLKPPWWQRSYLDLILLGISGYGIFQLQQQGSLFVVGENSGDSPFQNPLLFLLPAIMIFSTTLVSLRLLPHLMNAAAWLLQFSNNIALLQASRYLARSPRTYVTPLILLVLTVSFAIYTASMARTLDFAIYDQLYYQTGSDLNLFTPPRSEGGFLGSVASNDPNDFLVLPLAEYEKVEGVNRATRVSSNPGFTQVGSSVVSGTVFGIDRDSFPNVTFWRNDFSAYRLGSLMNALGNHSDGILVSESFLRRSGLSVGDPLIVTIKLLDQDIEFSGQIVGSVKQFPTWYPGQMGELFVVNLNSINDLAGRVYPYRVWINTNGNSVDPPSFRRNIERIGLASSTWEEPHTTINTNLGRPERQGLFGLLSVGFLTSSVLTILGLGLYGIYSYQRRVVELGILRAVGLATVTMTRLIAWELALLILFGLSIGSLLGISISRFFIPFLQVGVTAIASIPSMIVEIAWDAVSQVYLLYGLMFLLAFAALTLITMRMRIFLAIKLGETV